jgi:hypothetical protein
MLALAQPLNTIQTVDDLANDYLAHFEKAGVHKNAYAQWVITSLKKSQTHEWYKDLESLRPKRIELASRVIKLDKTELAELTNILAEKMIQ